MATTSFETTQLDFDTIKANLTKYLRRQSEFADYDFEASGLSNILDVLAYNTHFNALTANFALNEAYLSSAQLRSSVISIAQTLGYDIRSRSSSIATVALSLNLSSAGIKPTAITLPANTKFTTSVDGIAYTFRTRSVHTAVNDGSNIYVFVTDGGSVDIPVYEGLSRTKTFIVQGNDERQVFVIPDDTIDTSLATVKVFDTYSSTSFVSYTPIAEVTSIQPLSRFYKILETPNGRYELSFGDGETTGTKPVVGNKVEIEYVSCVGPTSNGASTFSPVSQIPVNGVNYDISVVVTAAAHSGALRQSIESIRQNAPLGFAAQKRLVTAEDYETTILTKFPSVQDVVAWGGEDNDPPNYGVVYVGLLFDDNVSDASKTSVKDTIKSTLNENLAVLSIDVSFVDPVITYLEIESQFEFNPNLTSVTQNTIETRVQAEVNAYVNTTLQSFTGTFRKSNLQTEIDQISPAILSTTLGVKLQQRLTPITVASTDNNSQTTAYTLSFPTALSAPKATTYTIQSSSFEYNGTTCRIKNLLGSNKLQVVDPNNNPIIDNIGSYQSTTGKLSLVGFAPGVISSGDSFIKITAVPSDDNTLRPLRNYYFDIDPAVSFAAATIDRGETSVNLA
jgi:hypothetical protein